MHTLKSTSLLMKHMSYGKYDDSKATLANTQQIYLKQRIMY